MDRLVACSFSVFILAAGCVGLFDDRRWDPLPAWEPDPCDPHGDPAISRNAPLLPAFAGSLDDFVERLVEATGDHLAPERTNAHPSYGPEDYETQPIWATQRGFVYYADHEVTFLMERAWPPLGDDAGRAALEGLIAALDVPPSSNFRVACTVEHGQEGRSASGRVYQTFGDEEIHGPGLTATVHEAGHTWGGAPNLDHFLSSLTVGRVHDLAQAEASVAPEAVRQAAGDFAQCVWGRQTQVEPWPLRLHVLHESLIYAALVAPAETQASGWPLMTVYVDAATGAVHGHETGHVSETID